MTICVLLHCEPCSGTLQSRNLKLIIMLDTLIGRVGKVMLSKRVLLRAL